MYIKNKRQIQQVIAGKRKTYTKFLAMFGNQVSLASFNCNKEIAKEIVKISKEVIKQQSFNWKPLSPRYLAKKISEGHDHRIYIRTGELLASISWGVTHGRVWTGIPGKKIHKDSGKPLWLLTKWLEFGTKFIPPRPIWRPILAAIIKRKPAFAKRYQKELLRSAKRIMKVVKP